MAAYLELLTAVMWTGLWADCWVYYWEWTLAAGTEGGSVGLRERPWAVLMAVDWVLWMVARTAVDWAVVRAGA